MTPFIAPTTLVNALFAQTAIADGSPGFTHTPLFWALILGAFGLWLLLPAGATPVRALGALSGGFSLVMLFLAAPLAGWGEIIAAGGVGRELPALVVAALSLAAIGFALGAVFTREKLFVAFGVLAAVLWVAAIAGIAFFKFSPPLRVILIVAFTLGGVLLFFPGARRRQRSVGVLFAALALGLIASLAPGLADEVEQALFGVLATLVVVSAVATISMRSPVYSAIWFAVTLLTTGGILLLQGAAFLGVATVVVYAGAILVTFLFVLMLAQPEGHAYYDRISWGPYAVFVAALAGMATVGGLTYRFVALDERVIAQESSAMVEAVAVTGTTPAGDRAAARLPGGDNHMVGLGGNLFGRHLIAVEAAGVLLFAALVGAASINVKRKEVDAPRTLLPATNHQPPAAT